MDERGETVEVVLQSESHLQRKLLMFAYGFGTIVMIIILMSTNEVCKLHFLFIPLILLISLSLQLTEAISYHRENPQVLAKLVVLGLNR